jgi:hypothetical protein
LHYDRPEVEEFSNLVGDAMCFVAVGPGTEL